MHQIYSSTARVASLKVDIAIIAIIGYKGFGFDIFRSRNNKLPVSSIKFIMFFQYDFIQYKYKI